MLEISLEKTHLVVIITAPDPGLVSFGANGQLLLSQYQTLALCPLRQTDSGHADSGHNYCTRPWLCVLQAKQTVVIQTGHGQYTRPWCCVL